MSQREQIGPETAALARRLDEVNRRLKTLQTIMIGVDNPPQIVLDGGMLHKQDTRSKAATFTDIEYNTIGFNLVQVATNGNLDHVSYRIRHIDGTLGDPIEASLSPHVIGKTFSVQVSNDTAEAGTTVFIDKYLAPYSMLSAIQHGLPIRGGSASEARLTPIAKGRIFNTTVATATDFFGAELTVTNSPTMFMIDICMATAAVLNLRVTSGGTTVVLPANEGGALAVAKHIFFQRLRSGDTFNIRHGDAGTVTVRYCLVDEIPAATQG